MAGASALSGAVVLAETGDLARFASGRALVRHAGLNPSEHTSATINGQTRISRRGRPGLRTAAWRAVWSALRHNTILLAKHAHLTGRDQNRLAGGEARLAPPGSPVARMAAGPVWRCAAPSRRGRDRGDQTRERTGPPGRIDRGYCPASDGPSAA